MKNQQTAYWWERRGGMWDSFDPDPRRSYYKFLRAVYQMNASSAWRAGVRRDWHPISK